MSVSGVWYYSCQCVSVVCELTGLLAEGDLDERAMDAIKEFPAERALDVLAEFRQSNLEHVTNKSAFLCSIMKVNRQKIKSGSSGTEQPVMMAQRRPGPDEAKIKAGTNLLEWLLCLLICSVEHAC